MIVVLNGPLGIGKSTLAEALTERIDGCVMLDGDHLIALNPPPPDEVEYLHSTLALLIDHHRRAGYRHFVVNHLWRTAAELDHLRRRLREVGGDDDDIHCFLLTLPLAENLRRIEGRRQARAIDEDEFEQRTVAEERGMLFDSGAEGLGEPFDVSAAPDRLVTELLRRLETQMAADRAGLPPT